MKWQLPFLQTLALAIRCACERASVNFTFVVQPSGSVADREGKSKYAVTELDHSVRSAFPSKDILVTEFTFQGVQVNGVSIFDHMEAGGHLGGVEAEDGLSGFANLPPPPPGMHWIPVPHDQLVYHHTVIHQGTFDSFDHAHGGYVFGTAGGQRHSDISKTTSFKPYGIRFRPETPVFTCIHAENARDRAIEYTALWSIEYEELSRAPDVRSLLAGWIHVDQLYSTDSNEGINGFTHPYEVNFRKDVAVVGFIIHGHAWLSEFEILHGRTTLYHDAAEATMTNKMDDSHIRWLEQPHHIKRGESMLIKVSGQYNPFAERVYEWGLPFAVSFFVTSDDGTDLLHALSDLYLIKGLTDDARRAFGDDKGDPNYPNELPWPPAIKSSVDSVTESYHHKDSRALGSDPSYMSTLAAAFGILACLLGCRAVANAYITFRRGVECAAIYNDVEVEMEAFLHEDEFEEEEEEGQ